MKTNKIPLSYWDEVARRYYEAETSESEEFALKRFLVSAEADDPRWDELRAVMGFLVCARRAESCGKQVRKPVVPYRRYWMEAAAVVVMAMGVTFWLSRPVLPEDVCVAYVGGNKILDESRVMFEMQRSLQRVSPPESAPTIESQLGDMFETLDAGV